MNAWQMAKGRQHFTFECVSILSIWHTLNIWEYAMSVSVIYLLWLGIESCNSHIKVSHTCMDALLVHKMHRQKNPTIFLFSCTMFKFFVFVVFVAAVFSASFSFANIHRLPRSPEMIHSTFIGIPDDLNEQRS